MSANQNDKPTKITEMDATDLVGRLVLNENGAEFIVVGLDFQAHDGRVWIQIEAINDDGEPDGDTMGLPNIKGWSIHHKVRR